MKYEHNNNFTLLLCKQTALSDQSYCGEMDNDTHFFNSFGIMSVQKTHTRQE